MTHQETPSSNLVSFDQWLTELGKTRITGFRWRKRGLIKTVNMFGRLYVSREAIAAFERRAMNGEFANEFATPPPPRKANGKAAKEAA